MYIIYEYKKIFFTKINFRQGRNNIISFAKSKIGFVLYYNTMIT